MKELLPQLKELARKVAPKVGFPIFYLFCFVIFCSWTFPYDRLKERLILGYNAGQRAAGSQQQLERLARQRSPASRAPPGSPASR